MRKWIFDHGGECAECHAVGLTELNKENYCYRCFWTRRKKNKPFKAVIDRDFSTGNIKPLPQKSKLSTRTENEKLKQITAEFNKNLKELGLK